MQNFQEYISELIALQQSGTDADLHRAAQIMSNMRADLHDTSEQEMNALMDLAINPIPKGPHPHMSLASKAITLLAEIAINYPAKSRTAVKCLQTIAQTSSSKACQIYAPKELLAIVRIIENEIRNPAAAAIIYPHCAGAVDAAERQMFAYEALLACYEAGNSTAAHGIIELGSLKAEFNDMAQVVEQHEAARANKPVQKSTP